MCVRCAWWFSSPSLHFSSSWDISADLLCPARFSIFMKEKKGAVELMGRSCKSGTGSSSSFPRVDFGNLFSPHPYYVFIFSCLPFNEMKLTRYIHPRAMVALGAVFVERNEPSNAIPGDLFLLSSLYSRVFY